MLITIDRRLLYGLVVPSAAAVIAISALIWYDQRRRKSKI